MSKEKVKRIIVVGEGSKSEPAYVQYLNRFMREKGVRLHFQYIPACGGDFSTLHRIAVRQQKDNRHVPVVIWLDYDRYNRNDARDAKKLHDAKARGSRECLLFNHQNFEDFLCLHFDSDTVLAWQKCCLQEGHFAEGGAMNEERYIPLFLSNVCAAYSKGDFDYEAYVNEMSLHRLFLHNRDTSILFSSDFASLMEIELKKAGYVTGLS